MKRFTVMNPSSRAHWLGGGSALLAAVAGVLLAGGGLQAGWERIGGPKGVVVSRVLGGSLELYATDGPGLDPTGDIGVYTGKGGWQRVGAPGSAFAVGPSTALHPWLVGLSVDRKIVWMMTYATVSQHKPGVPDPVAKTVPQWTQIGGHAELGGDIVALYGGGAGVFAERSDFHVLRYDGQLASIDPVRWTNGAKWTDINAGGGNYAVNDMNIFGYNNVCVYQYIGGPWSYHGGPWKIIYDIDDNPFGAPQKLYAGGRKLFLVGAAKGEICRWEGTPSQWTRVGGPGKMFAVTAGGELYGLSPDGRALNHYDEWQKRWENIGRPGKPGDFYNPKGPVARRIIGGGLYLYAEMPNGELWQYSTNPWMP